MPAPSVDERDNLGSSALRSCEDIHGATHLISAIELQTRPENETKFKEREQQERGQRRNYSSGTVFLHVILHFHIWIL